MTAMVESLTELRGSFGRGFNWQLFLQDNVTGSVYQMIWIAILTGITAAYTVSKFNSVPLSTSIILVAWVIGILMVVIGELAHRHSTASRWLKENLLSSVSNTLLTLFLSLFILSLARSIWLWAYVNANFNPAETAPEFQRADGATWGVVWGARKLLLTGLLEPEHSWRVFLALIFIVGLWAINYAINRPGLRDKTKRVRQLVVGLWLLSPVILYIFLAGVSAEGPFVKLSTLLTGAALLVAAYALFVWQKVIQFRWSGLAVWALAWPLAYVAWRAVGRSGVFPPLNVDNWGGLLLTLIVASSVIVLSFPLGMILALGRRSQVYGIPTWIVWPVAIIATIWGFTTTPQLLAEGRNTIEKLFAFWPILIVVATYFFQRYFQGNVVAGASTTFIELVRSVPLITLLFMGIIMAPFFFGEGISIAKPWPVIVGYTLFSSAYMAEVIRGGLQAIPKGQFEAADALGFNTLQKMRFIILPQALRIVIPAIVGQFIGAFKSSSLVSIVGLFDLLGIQRAILSNPQWLGLRKELYVVLAIVYFLGSSVMSAYSRRLEVRLGLGER
ncbi:MAG: amino acid ABC transporter permease [Anaerolineae bacterium]